MLPYTNINITLPDIKESVIYRRCVIMNDEYNHVSLHFLRKWIKELRKWVDVQYFVIKTIASEKT